MNGSGVLWDPEQDEPYYGWRHPVNNISFPRDASSAKNNGPGLYQNSTGANYRRFAEETILNGHGGPNGRTTGLRNWRHITTRGGFGQMGGDLWPVNMDPSSPPQNAKSLCQRYTNEGSTGFDSAFFSILGPGGNGPAPTGRYQMLREGLQEAEVRMFVQDALLDHKDKLGPDLAKRCQEVCDEQVRLLRYFVEMWYYAEMAPQAIRQKSMELYALADEVAAALEKQGPRQARRLVGGQRNPSTGCKTSGCWPHNSRCVSSAIGWRRNPNQFITYMGLLQSPDSVALEYKVPMWSEEHWKRLDKTFELLGQLGNRELYVALITKTFLGHEHSMVCWVKQADGTCKPDFSIAERYIDLAVKHKWNTSVVGLHLSDGAVGSNFSYGGKPRNPPSVTVVDPATGALSEMEAPKWGTPEAQAFWKPVIEGMRGILAKRGLQQAMMFSFVIQHNILPEAISDLKTVAPDVKWVAYCALGREDCRHQGDESAGWPGWLCHWHAADDLLGSG